MRTRFTTLAIGGLLSDASARARCCAVPDFSRSVDKDPTGAVAGLKMITLRITGMSCAQRVTAEQQGLRGVEGGQGARVSLERAQAVITVASDRVKPEQLIGALEKAGSNRHAFKAEAAGALKCTSCGKTCDGPGGCCAQPTRDSEGGS